MSTIDTCVIGGGLAGLAAATWLARAGQRVVLLEAGKRLGGRAATANHHGFRLNLGPHALYCGGPAERALRGLGIPTRGRKPPTTGHVLRDGELLPMPSGPWTMATSPAIAGARIEVGSTLTGVLAGNLRRLDGVPLADWLAGRKHPATAELVAALVRVSTYSNDPLGSAGAALAQVRNAVLHSVRYLDGGWQTLVDGLAAAAEEGGVQVETLARVASIDDGVALKDGSRVDASNVLLAVPAQQAAPLLPDGGARSFAAAAVPVRAACLDLGLRRLPRPDRRFVLGLDEPVYLSEHTPHADLADEGSVVHVARYLAPGEERTRGSAALRQGLEAVMDLAQPGWRDEVVAARFLPAMTVQSAAILARDGGLAGRPAATVRRGLYLAGDWVGPEGLLVDGSFASARQAVAAILSRAEAAA